jgi:hypothetical protein
LLERLEVPVGVRALVVMEIEAMAMATIPIILI